MIKLTNAEYHDRTDSVSKSMLDKIHKAPACLRAYLDGERAEPTPAMVFGTAAHTAVLEPDKLVCAPKLDKRTKAGKEAADIFASLWEGRDVVIVDPDTRDTVRAIADSVWRHPVARRVLSQGEPELSFFGEIDGIPCKARTDWLNDRTGIIADLKTTNDASPAGVARSVANYRYHVQNSFYTDVTASAGFHVESFVFIFVEKTPPYLVGTYVLDTEALDIGREEYQRDLALYRECMEIGIWPGLSERLELITLPRWAKPQTEEEWT